ncbi:hypothetical protein OC834_000090 [Tilletia horrida]|nr:hypothetical protein OC834_000090 [Tilletia horrida]
MTSTRSDADADDGAGAPRGNSRVRLALPPEIARRVAVFLQPECTHAYPLCLRKAPSPFRMADLLAFASTCLSLRCLLAPLLWSSLVFHYPERLAELQDVLRYYSKKKPGERSGGNDPPAASSSSSPASPASRRTSRSKASSSRRDGAEVVTVGANDVEQSLSIEFELLSFRDADEAHRPRLPDPLPLVRNFFLAFPRRVAKFDLQGFLLLLGHLPQLEYLSWDAEITPPSSLWEKIAPIRGLHVDCKIFWQGNPGLSKLSDLESFALTTFDANLLPNHVPTLLLNLPTPLTALDMSTSKTSVLHDESLIEAGCFSRLEHLTVYAVTPETPLDRALISAGNSLRSLSLFTDVNGGFRNYDDLWRSLAGHMKVLEVLNVDPHPQQNTAPSFVDFVIATPTLHRINERETSGLPPDLSLFDPEHPTGALAY